jgi:hypothetical protein
MSHFRWYLAVVIAFLFSTIPTESLAQRSGSEPSTVPVVIMIPQSSANAQAAVITRRATEGYRIVIPRAVATEQNLHAAISRVSQLLARDGNTLRDDQVFTVDPNAVVSAQGRRPVGHRLLAELMKEERSHSNAGRHTPTVTIRLSSTRSRQ